MLKFNYIKFKEQKINYQTNNYLLIYQFEKHSYFDRFLLMPLSFKMDIIFIIFCICLISINQSQLLSIDFGTQYIKASIVHSGAGKSFSIVQNSKSQRKFHNILGFYNEERYYENDALPKRTRFPENCFIYSRILIDLFDQQNIVKKVKKQLFLDYIKDNKKQSSSNQLLAEFILKNFPQQTKHVTLLQIMTMILKYIKTQAQKYAKSPIKDVVLILPNYWNIYQRNFLLQAASVAEIHVLSIITQNTAASINYALSQRDQNKTENVLFYNLGSNALQMTLVEYKQVITQGNSKPIQSIFIKDDYGRAYVGGLRFDSIISDYFAGIFEQKHKKKLDRKGMIKLLEQSAQVKQTLTANKQAMVFVQGIMDGIDFSAKITRMEFQKRSEQLLKELTNPLKRFLLDNDMKVDDLHSVELIGGSSRIPKLQSMIVEILKINKNKIGTHINGDQAMALGGAFFAANSSKKFKVKGMNLYDGFNFQIRLVLRNLDQSIKQSDNRYFYKNATIFKKKSRYGLNKQVNFKCQQNIIADLYQVDQQGNEQLIKSYEFNDVEKINQTDYKLSLVFTIDPLEVVILKDSKFNFKKDEIQTYLEKVKVPKKSKSNQNISKNEKINKEDQNKKQKDNIVNQEQQKQEQEDKQKQKEQQQKVKEEEQATEQNKSKQQTQQQQQQQKQQQQTQNNKTKSSKQSKRNKKQKKQQQQFDYQTVQKNKTVTKKYQKSLHTKQTFSHHKKQQQSLNQRTRQLLKNYQRSQQKKRILSQSKNKLQSIIYQIKDKLQNQQFIVYSRESQRQNLLKQVLLKEQWHDQTNSKNPNDYKQHYNELNKPLDRIKKRMIEHYERESVKNKAEKIIEEYKNLTEKIKQNKEWITDEQVEELKNSIKQAEKKLKEIYQSMQQTKINEDCLFKNKDMIRQTQNIKDKYFSLKAKPKPTKKQTKEKAKESQKKNQQQSDNDNKVNEDQL